LQKTREMFEESKKPVEARLQLDGLREQIMEVVEQSLQTRFESLSSWPYYSAEETAKLLQITVKHLLDKRYPYINELEYAQHGKRIFWFKKDALLQFIEKRLIVRNRGRIPLKDKAKIIRLKAA
jgi:hypothetical protein